jgi:hypothetical protein
MTAPIARIFWAMSAGIVPPDGLAVAGLLMA